MKKYIYITILLAGIFGIFALNISCVRAWDFSTPENTLETLEREYFDNENFDLYENSTYYSPALIKKIGSKEYMDITEYRQCGMKILKNNYFKLKEGLGLDNFVFDRLEITDKEEIDGSHVHMKYRIYFQGQDEFTDKPYEPWEDEGYFVKIGEEWRLDLEPEFNNILEDQPDTRLCPLEQRMAIDLENRLGYEVLWADPDGVRAAFLIDNYMIIAGFWGENYDFFGVDRTDDPVRSFRYSFSIRDLITRRNFNAEGIEPELGKRLDYIMEIIKLFEAAPHDYFDIKSRKIPQVMFNLNNIDDRIIEKELYREYSQEEKAEGRSVDNEWYMAVVTANLDERTLLERYNKEREERHNAFEKKQRRAILLAPLLKFISNPLTSLSVFVIQLLIGLGVLFLFWRVFKIENIFKKKFNLTILYLALIRTFLQLIFVQCYVEVVTQGLSTLGLSLGWPFGFLYGVIIFMIAVDVLTGLAALFILRFYSKTKWWQALVIAVVYGLVSFYLGSLIYNLLLGYIYLRNK